MKRISKRKDVVFSKEIDSTSTDELSRALNGIKEDISRGQSEIVLEYENVIITWDFKGKEFSISQILGHVKCKCGGEGLEEHTCPYQEDIHADSETLCNCCEVCINNCSQDI